MSAEPSIGDLRVWHIPQIPGPAFHVNVSSVGEAVALCDVLADYDQFQFQHRIKPDHCNANGIERYEEDGDGGAGWCDVDVEWEVA